MIRPELPLDPKDPYWARIRQWALDSKSDGCTGVKDYYVDSCYEHDYHYVHGRTLFGDPITKKEADIRFREVIQSRSRLGKWSPMSWWRYFGVKWFGRGVWAEKN